jgi:hypothetical protein
MDSLKRSFLCTSVLEVKESNTYSTKYSHDKSNKSLTSKTFVKWEGTILLNSIQSKYFCIA